MPPVDINDQHVLSNETDHDFHPEQSKLRLY